MFPILVCLLAFFYLWHQPYHAFTPPVLAPHAVAGLALLIGLHQGPSALAWAWWGWGLLSLLWSLAPGHTLVASLWELWALVALAAGRWRLGVLILLALLLLDGLYTALALWQAGLVSYVSGSHHYLLGALALGALPLFLARAGRVEAYGVASFLLAVLAFYAALISGARAVYLPLLLLLPSALLLLAREAGWRSLLLFLALGAGVVLLEGVVPGNALLNALTYKLALTQAEAQGESPGQGTPAMGNVEARLHMWRLALRLALDHPLGVGNGAYSQVFEAYMDYPGLPGVWSRSPHNHFLETLATGGWPRFILLLALLLPSLQGLGRQDWPWSLAVLGLWTPMLFDVSGYYPGYLALAFLLLGAFPQPAAPRTLGVAGLLAASLATLYWFWPCQGAACARQHLYFPQDTAKAVLQASREEAARLLAEAQRRYPLSPWPLTLAWEHTQDPEERLLLSRELARRFPNARESFYLLWAQSALGAGKPEEAQRALREGLRRFPSSHRLRELLAPQAPGQTRPP